MAINREKVLASAQTNIEKRRFDKAIVELRSVVDADPSDVRTLHKVGELQLKLGRYADAVDAFETVGKLYAQGGFAAKAVAVYTQVREIIATHAPQCAPRYGHIAPKLALLHRELGRKPEALAILQGIVADLERQGRGGDALEYVRQIAELDAQNPLAHLRLAEASARARDIDGAVAAFDTAAQLLLEGHRGHDAILVLERRLQHRPDPAQARRVAELYLARGRAPEDGMQALGRLQICVQAAPKDASVLELVARAFDMVGQRDKAASVRMQIARLRQ
jgi:tetratricopeptide (TPR) repeat protein